MARNSSYIPDRIVTLPADAAIANRRFVGVTSEDATFGTPGVSQIGTAGDPALGVSKNPAAVKGNEVEVAHEGGALVEAGAAIGRGVLVASDNQGRAIPVAGNHQPLGYTLGAATAAGDVISIKILS